MIIELSFPKCKKYIKILNIPWTMDFWILMTIFETPYKTYEYELLSCATCITFMYSKLWDIASLMFNKQKIALNEWNISLIYCVMDFLKSHKLNYFKSSFEDQKWLFYWTIFLQPF